LGIVEAFEHQQIATVINNGDHYSRAAFFGLSFSRGRDSLRRIQR